MDSTIPSLPKTLYGLTGTQIPNGDLLVCGERIWSDDSNEYLHYKEGSNQWQKVGTMKTGRRGHSLVWIDDRLLTTGGSNFSRIVSGNVASHLEEFSFDGGAQQRKKMPIGLKYHTATVFDQHKMIVCGGVDETYRYGVSKTFFKLKMQFRFKHKTMLIF